jgi:anti-sigma factor RsiW
MTQTPDHLNPGNLSAYIDGELPPAESQAVRQHIAECHVCALRVVSAMQLKTVTARTGQRFAPPPDTLARLTAQVQQKAPQKTARILSFRTASWAALAACLLLAILLVGWQQNRQANTLSAELLDQHLATLSSGSAPQVISTDRHTVKPWFQGKLPFSFNIPEPLPADTALKGGDLTYLKGQPAALLLFTIHKHEVSVFLTQRSGSPIATARSGVRSGFTIEHASTRDLQIVAVSDVNPADLEHLVSALVQAQSPN